MKQDIINLVRIKAQGLISLYLFILLPFLMACSNEDYLGGHSTTDGAGVEMGASSAAALTAGEHIGLFTSKGTLDASTRNREFIVQSDGYTLKSYSGQAFYIKGNTSVIAYYPFQGADGSEPELLLDVEDQTAPTDYYVAKTNGVTIDNGRQVELDFAPCLSTLSFTFLPVKDDIVQSYSLKGVKKRGRINPYQFTISSEDVEDADKRLFSGPVGSSQTISIISVPQSLAEGSAVLTVKGSVTGRTYDISLPAVNIMPNTTCQVTVDVATGLVTYAFVSNSPQWTDSGQHEQITIAEPVEVGYDYEPGTSPQWTDSGQGKNLTGEEEE